jgi:hypothetical protein
MHTSSLFATTLLALVAAVGGTANADHQLYRELDDLNNHAMRHARDARWEVHDHFVASRDYDDLLEDSRTLTKALRNVEDAIFFERSPRAILSLARDAHDVLVHFEEHAEQSEFNRISWHGRTRVRPAGYTHVVQLQSILVILHQDMDQLIAVLEPYGGHSHGHELEIVPDPQYRIEPGVPSPGPAFPGVHAPDLSASSGVSFPLVRTRSGGSVLPVVRH